MNKSSVVILVIIAVIFVAGCTLQREVTTHPDRGITINSFSAYSDEVRSGSTVLFDLEIENIGGTTAKNVEAELLGVEGKWRDTNGDLLTDTQKKGPYILRPPDIYRNLPGDFRPLQWELMTPSIPQGTAPNLEIIARVTYDYNTSGHLEIKAVSIDEKKRKDTLGEEITNPVTILNSAGPIKISIPSVYNIPIIVDTEDPEPDYTQPLGIEFINVGDGWPITEDVSGKITGTIELFGPGAEFSDCLGTTSGQIVYLDNSEIPARLRDTMKFPVACEIKIDKSVWGDRSEDKISLVFNIFYRYYVKDTVSVKVFGR